MMYECWRKRYNYVPNKRINHKYVIKNYQIKLKFLESQPKETHYLVI